MTRILEGEQDVEYDSEKMRPDGTVVPCIVSATPFRRPDGTTIGIVEDFKDISKRKKAERNLKITQCALAGVDYAALCSAYEKKARSRIAREIHDELSQVLLRSAWTCVG